MIRPIGVKRMLWSPDVAAVSTDWYVLSTEECVDHRDGTSSLNEARSVKHGQQLYLTRVGKRVRKRAHDSRTAAALHRGARKAAQLTSLCRACDRLRHS